MSAPRERPILMAGPMVCGSLAGTKLQTRRLVKLSAWHNAGASSLLVDPGIYQNYCMDTYEGRRGATFTAPSGADVFAACPYEVGDAMWVRETWAPWDKETRDELDFASKRGNSPDPRLDLPAIYRADFPGETDPREIGAASKCRVRLTVRNGRKWCSGPCGRELAASEFYRSGDGYPNAECKACHRVAERDRYRRRARSRAWVRAENARKLAGYYARKAAA